MFGQINVLIGVEGCAETFNSSRSISHREPSGRGEGAGVEDGQALVIIIIINGQRLPRDKIGNVSSTQRAAVGTDPKRSSARVLENTSELPAVQEILCEHTAPVEEAFPGAQRQFVEPADVQYVFSVIARDGPKLLLVELIHRGLVECREATIGIRHCLGKSVGHQETHAAREALLNFRLDGIVVVNT